MEGREPGSRFWPQQLLLPAGGSQDSGAAGVGRQRAAGAGPGALGKHWALQIGREGHKQGQGTVGQK